MDNLVSNTREKQIEKLKQDKKRLQTMNEEKWNKKYKLAKAYYEHYENLEVKAKFKTINGYEYDENGINLGDWIYTQRRAYKEQGNSKITEETSNLKLEFGTGNILEKNIIENANNKIKIDADNKSEIQISYKFDDNNLNLINNIEIMAQGQTKILIKYESDTNKKCFHNGAIRLNAKPNSKVDICIINMMNNSSNNFESIENKIEEKSEVKYTVIDIGAQNSVSNYYSNIIGKEAKNDLKTIYLGIQEQKKDINYIAHLKGEKSEIDIDVQGALNDKAKKNFKGTIDFKKGCKKAKGNENEFCMLLSEKAKSLALPMLLCTEDDVEGNHSTASGKVDKEQLFYIMTRGLSYKEAVKLIVRANFNKTIERILDEEVKQNIIKEIDERLD